MVQRPEKTSQTESLDSLKVRVQNNPQDGVGWLALAQTLAQTQTGSELHEAISKSIELLPDEYQAWLLAGFELQHRQGPAAAQAWLQQICRQRPTLSAPRLAMVQLQAMAAPATAIAGFEQLIESFPEDARGHLLLAECLQNVGRIHEAGNQLEKALALKPEVAENWAALAMIRLGENRLEAAVEAATQALERNSGSLGARLTRADAYRQAAQWDRALQDYQEVFKDMPKNPFVFLGIGACLAGKGEFDAAMEQFHQSVRIKPDLHEARLNIALVLASQAKASAALTALQEILKVPSLAQALRQPAEVALASLQEHQRLDDAFRHADGLSGLASLQQSLSQAPPRLTASDPAGAAKLSAMAEAARQQDFDEAVFRFTDNPDHRDFVEACLLCRAASDVPGMVAIWQEIETANLENSACSPDAMAVAHTWKVVRDRQMQPLELLEPGQGEAWLRYWHYRIFSESPGHLPGMFKMAPNSIGLHQTTAPQHLLATVRALMDEIRPTIPAGLGRALFMLASINQVHGFIDGNGRLARFFFAWELEYAGHQALLFPPALRRELARCLDHAQYKQDFEPFGQYVARVHEQSREMMQQFSALM